MVLRKDQIEASLQEEKKLIEDGKLKEDNPLDVSETFFRLCEACRCGDLKTCQETITEGVNINARDRFDYTPLILASLCGHFEVVQLLLESGALCERDTFQGERCLYNALNDRIRNLLLSYDYSKSTDPLQPLASHITSLLTREHPQTSDILVAAAEESFRLHKFILSARSPYFAKKLSVAPDTASWKLPSAIPPQAFGIAIKYIYLGEISNDVGGGPGTGFSEDEVLEGIDKISRQLEIISLWDGILESGDRRLARQRRTDEVDKGRNQLEAWFSNNVLKHKIILDTARADNVKWDCNNGVFADVLLRADESDDAFEIESPLEEDSLQRKPETKNGIPIGPLRQASRSPSRDGKPRKSILFPVHRAMLLRSEYFLTMFSSAFREAQATEYLHIISMDCSPEVLEVVLQFLYTEKTDFPLEIAIDVLFAADHLLIEKLKMKAAVVISTLGNGSMSQIPTRLDAAETSSPAPEELDIYDVVRAGWLTRVPRLEEFGARYLAYRLESYIDEEDFADLVRESANRIKGRQETDTIELLDDIRYYLSERFRLRFEDSGLEDMMEEEPTIATEAETDIDGKLPEDEGVDMGSLPNGDAARGDVNSSSGIMMKDGSSTIRTLDGEMVGDELEGDAINYQILLGKIEGLLTRLKLDA
ncbi:hypothetical protein HO133_004038 [Letharia lupina]|uniref:BTB domain-containing protein n=1 Tax=Letharia lupina TaxID=560253 RepID=A0A8H6CA00_9LECA|nr:uncharacterized protein HO133_004038 [Letharia lupina]KAF6219569.1 hypothetical protein HO133_004038 [Letharia lupina]